ncbi:helix-turn-helix domain-containing protein [Pseudomonas sp. Q1-7]|uniref:helix-turn-helix domain-containing protein n=1 Tax=Pseudomonas sp. Q1-7 TaxID=3020843 RepID=UPI0022FFDA6F|nr:helix-turn-helix domain-containing protein [Pseudomonas sp. Q1-7]
MDIAEVARRSGIPASTLRFYEKKGLLRSLSQRGSRRWFAPGILDQLALISLGQAAGLSLDEIRSMFSPDDEPNIDRDLLLAKADEIDARVKRLKAMSDGLRHAAACPAPRHSECPSFKRLLKAASSGAIERRWNRATPKRPAPPAS